MSTRGGGRACCATRGALSLIEDRTRLSGERTNGSGKRANAIGDGNDAGGDRDHGLGEDDGATSDRKCTTFGRDHARFGRVNASFERNCERFECNCQRFERNCQRFERNCERFERNSEHFERNCEHFERNCERFELNCERFELNVARKSTAVAPESIAVARKWIFGRAYERANDAQRKKVVDAYLDYMMAKVAYHDAEAVKLFDREIRQVLLVHANALNAAAFGKLADRLAKRGHRFITLERALEDPAYRSPDKWRGAGGISWLDRWAITRGVPKGFFANEPRTPEGVQELAGVRE